MIGYTCLRVGNAIRIILEHERNGIENECIVEEGVEKEFNRGEVVVYVVRRNNDGSHFIAMCLFQ